MRPGCESRHLHQLITQKALCYEGVTRIDQQLKLSGVHRDDTGVTRSIINANKKALRFADLTVGASQMRLAA